jgi:hypothetical protein
MELLAMERPFPHVLAAQVLTANGEAQVLSRLQELEWREWSGEFFRFHIAANSDQLASLLALPVLQAMVGEIKPALELHLKTSLFGDVSCAVHLYDENSVIGFHTDEAVSDLRFVLNLNRNWALSDGGAWVLANEPALPAAIFLPPLSNTGFAFATSSDTFHALGRRSGNLSYAIVIRYPLLQAIG